MKSGLTVAIVFFILAAASAGAGGLGISYVTAEDAIQQQLFYRVGANRINKGAAGKGMIPIGFGMSVALVVAGVLRLRKGDDDEGYYEDDE
ncbi:MAG: hypothetical protein CMH57_05620 [Myxococcales bacterium]|nr:hypothetical protein [Myxococcales bacterium]